MSDLAQQADELESLTANVAPTTLADQADELEAISKEKHTASKGESPLGTDSENFLAGAGKAVVDMGRGAKQLIDIPAQWLEKRFPGVSAWSQQKGLPSATSSAAATEADVAESRALDAPLMKTGSGMSGDIAGNVAGIMLPLGIAAKAGSSIGAALLNPNTYKAAAASGALQGALQPTTGDESRVENTALGAGSGMVGNLAVNTVGRVAQPVANVLSNAHAKAVDILTQAGIPLDAAQKTGSTFLNKIRSSFSDNPFTAGAQSELATTQKTLYNRAVLKTIGEDAIAATPEVMDRAATRINGVFKDILDRNSVGLSDHIVSRIGTIQKDALEEEKKPVAALANRIVNSIGEDGKIPGQTAYGIKKDLDRLSSSIDTTLAYHARNLRSALMDAVNESLPKADQQAFSEARSQFSNMKTIEGTIDRTGNGDISASKLANAMAQKANRQKSVYGRGDQSLVDLAHAGNMLLPDKNPNSGTVARALMQVGLPLVAGGAEGVNSGGDMGKAAAAAAGAYALPKAAQAIMNNPITSEYLAKGMQGTMKPLRDLLLLPQKNQAVGGVLRRLPQTFNQQR